MNQCVTRHEQSLTVANESTYGHTLRQSEVLNGLLCNLRTFRRNELCDIGIGCHEEAHVVNVGIEHHLIDVAGGYRLLVDDGADVQTLSHTYVVDVLDHCHRLAHSHSLGCKTSEDISLSITGERHESLRILYALFDKKREVASVTVDDKRLVVLKN